MRLARYAAVVALCAAVGCAPPTSSDADDGGDKLPAADMSDVEVDTPELVKLKNAAGIADCPKTPAESTPEGGLPELTLPCLGGGPDVELAALRGKPLVLNFWASWCKPCREELPVLQRLHESGKVRVLGVDVEDPQPASALELARDSGVTFPSVADPGGASKAPLKVVGVPQTVFVRPNGTIAGTERVSFTSYDQLSDAVREHLGVAP